MRCRLSREADEDVESATEASYDFFGEDQASKYGDLIARAIGLAAVDPERPGSRARPDLGGKVRSFHVGLAARRRAAAAHVIFYAIQAMNGDDELVVLRVLHESMEPLNKVAVALAEEQPVTRSSRPRPPRSPAR